MSDYTSTFTEGTGDTIDTSDFSTEFDAIEAAIATKADVDSDTLTNLTIGSGYSGGAIIQETAVTTSGAATYSFTGIPSWVKKITLTFSGVIIPGGGFDLQLTLGDSGGLETTGYTSMASEMTDTGSAVVTEGYSTTEFILCHQLDTNGMHGSATLSLHDASNTWCLSGTMAVGVAAGAVAMYICAGSKSLSGALTQLQLSHGAAGNFGGGTWNILYEG